MNDTLRDAVVIGLATAIMLAGATWPVAAQSVLGTDNSGDIVEVVPGDATQTYPTFIVSYGNDSEQIDGWANASDDHYIVDTWPEYNRAVVATPKPSAMDVGILGQFLSGPAGWGEVALESESWVESVYPNWEITLDRPQYLAEDNFQKPDVGLFRFDDPALPTEGMAFSDEVNETTLGDARDVVDADNVSADGTGIDVAVIDTGVNTANGRLFGNGSSGSSIRIDNASTNTLTGESINTSADDYAAIEDGNGHGTWVGAAIAANTSNDTYDGVASDANLLIYKSLDDDGSGSTAAIARAIRLAADDGADVLSMSLGSATYSAGLAQAVSYATDNGVSAVVIAAGNSRPQRGAAVGSPADADGVIAVGATTTEVPNNTRSAYFSQVGPDPGTTDASNGETAGEEVDVGAPGFKLEAQTADTDGILSDETLSGTSMSTPILTGSVAAAMDADSSLADEEASVVHKRIRETAEAAPNMAAVETGHGLVDAENLATDTRPVADQETEMDSEASQRDVFYRALSDSSGGVLASLLP